MSARAVKFVVALGVRHKQALHDLADGVPQGVPPRRSYHLATGA
jgi:hypothetical protein